MVDDVINFNIKFLSTPSARRATSQNGQNVTKRSFLSTPSARRATEHVAHGLAPVGISIHALREEGDVAPACPAPAAPDFYPRPPRGGRLAAKSDHQISQNISIHALREEGDGTSLLRCLRSRIFLSTPSARRATLSRSVCLYYNLISIHALREEGD